MGELVESGKYRESLPKNVVCVEILAFITVLEIIAT